MYPMYPNCFDMLTTHGVIGEDLVGYVTGNPSPYLQNYVTQRGGQPSLPGQPLPDPLPNVPLQRTPVADTMQNSHNQPVYQPIAVQEPKDKWGTFKKVATGMLLAGLAVFGVINGKAIISKIKKSLPAPSASSTGKTWYQKVGDWFGKKINLIKNKFKNQGNPSTEPWYKKVGNWFKNLFTTKP